MKRIKILSLFFGILLSVSHLGAQDSIDFSLPQNDLTEQTLKVFIETKPSVTNVKFKNAAESLTGEHINRIVTTLEESSNVTNEISLALGTTLNTLNTLLEDKAFMQNKVIYQANKHYDLSESEVKRALRTSQQITLLAHGAISILILVLIVKIKLTIDDSGFIELDKVAVILLKFSFLILLIWFIAKPVANIIFNNNYEIIKFLLQGT